MASAKSLTLLALLAATCLHAQKAPTPFTDPANLRGERVKPRDGRELPIDQGARGLEQMLRRLNTRASLMLIVAHPDDEDGGMLTYYSRGLGARVAVLTLTRGEGGQNAMTGDFEDALGLLRTQELLSADRYLGVDQFFGTEVDFGFSKTKEEAFKKWTHERVLYDAVRSIRLYRPLVIAAVFIGGVTDGHGQHQVSGQIAQEAFKAAADPTVFPDMIAEGILPWQALKVYARVPMQSISEKGLFDYATGKYTAPRFENYVTGEVTTTVPSSDVIVHEGTVDPILSDNPVENGSAPPRRPALSYVQFARIGLGMQKSQIGGGVRVPPAGKFDVDYHLYGSALCSSPTHIKECHPERASRVEGSAVPPTPARTHEPSSHNTQSASFFDGIDTSIDGLQDYHAFPTDIVPRFAGTIDDAVKKFDSSHPDAIAPTLADALKICDELIRMTETSKATQIEKANALHELSIKRVQLNDALALAFGLSVDANASSTHNGDVFKGETFNVETTTKSQSNPNFKVEGEVLQSPPKQSGELEFPKWLEQIPIVNGMAHHTVVYPDHVDISSFKPEGPYFSRPTIEQAFYDLASRQLRNAPTTLPSLTAWEYIKYGDIAIEIGRIVHEGDQPISPVPPVNIAFSTHAQVLPSNHKTFTLLAFDRSQSANHGNYHLGKIELPDGFSSVSEKGTLPGASIFTVTVPDRQTRAAFTVKATANVSYGDSKLRSIRSLGDASGYRSIGYGDLPRTNYYTPATVRIVPVDLNLPSTHRIAYLPGTGDAVPEALASINLKPDILTVADLTPAKLSHYDTVILGVRTYNAHPDLHGAPTQALLDYARNGGNVLVQYQTAEFTAQDAPYPLTLGYAAEKVVDETAPVQLLGLCDQPGSNPPHPCEQSSMNNAGFLPGSLRDYDLLTTPNKITSADFNNWVEERGHGFLSTWDSHYTALTETHDPDQDPQRGGLITTNIGKGRWTYCAFALYRQLPEAVPGAYRLFVNLISPTPR